MSFFRKYPTTSLMKKDNLYKTVISKLPIQNRIYYCESLVYRIQKDFINSTCQLRKKELKTVLKLAEIELKYLRKKIFKS